MGKKAAMVNALCKELGLRKKEFKGEQVATIYFGGGTPSVLETEEIARLINTVREHYDVVDNPEITLEANPDDLSEEKILQLAASPINRLSIGIQSFFEEDYGMPNMTLERWKQNINKALDFSIPHISSYALTVEPKTALAKFVEDGLITPATDEETQEHFNLLNDTLLAEGFDCYEISNFGKLGYYSKNNSAYWQQKKYIGIGPSAHSFDGVQRGWNINNNPKYIKSIARNILPMEVEVLSSTDKYNEYVMTGLRTIWGVSLTRISTEFGSKYKEYILMQADKFLEEHLLFVDGDILKTTKKGMFLADGIAADLFMLNLK